MKIGARERHELAVCWVVHRLPPDNPGTKCGAVLLDIVSKIGLRRMRAGHKHFGDARERVADLAEEFMLSAHAAIMLACVVSVILHLVASTSSGLNS